MEMVKAKDSRKAAAIKKPVRKKKPEQGGSMKNAATLADDELYRYVVYLTGKQIKMIKADIDKTPHGMRDSFILRTIIKAHFTKSWEERKKVYSTI